MASGADIIQDDQTVFCDSGSECGKTGIAICSMDRGERPI